MNIAVNRAHFPVTVLGPGRRIGIWLQGCRIRCRDCVSQDTWAFDSGREMPVAQLLDWCRQTSAGVLDGVTLSGGEPFDQPRALAALLSGLLNWRAVAGLDFDVLCYSGYSYRRLQQRHAPLLQRLDALIPEPFQAAEPLTHVWRGSANQPLLALSERGRRKYAEFLEKPVADDEKRMQAMVDGQRVWYIGIPARGDLEALNAACRTHGVAFERASWKS